MDKSLSKNNNLIYLILFLAFILRLFQLFSPVVGAQSWRQADTAAMARNFYESDRNLLYPQIDWGGNKEGYVESELPIYPYIVSLFYEIFGINESLARFFSISLSLINIFFLFLIIKIVADEKIALWSAFIYSILPLNIFYSRVIMPEPLLLLSISAGIYFFIRWLEGDKMFFYVLSLLFITLACLIKIPTLYLSLPMIFLASQKYRKSTLMNWKILLYAVVIFVAVFFWYYHAHKIYIKSGLSFGIWGYGTDKWGNWDFVLTWEFWNGVLLKNIAEKHLTWLGFIVFLITLVNSRRLKFVRFFYVWLIACFIYLIIVAKGNYFHDYYQLPVILPMSFFIGKYFSDNFQLNPFSGLRTFLPIFFLTCMIVLGSFRLINYFSREDLEKNEKYKLAKAALIYTEKGSLIITVSSYDPMVLYNSHRKGWQLSPKEVSLTTISEIRKKGASYLLLNKNDFIDFPSILDTLINNYKVTYQDSISVIFNLLN